MVEVIIVIREPARLKPMLWYTFKLPALPRPGDYISVGGPDIRAPLGEDVVVRRVWWRLSHLSAGAGGDEEAPGQVEEIFVECDIAEGPYSSAAWRREIEFARASGAEVERFQVARCVIGTT